MKSAGLRSRVIVQHEHCPALARLAFMVNMDPILTDVSLFLSLSLSLSGSGKSCARASARERESDLCTSAQSRGRLTVPLRQ